MRRGTGMGGCSGLGVARRDRDGVIVTVTG
jgi:hypothetical protein